MVRCSSFIDHARGYSSVGNGNFLFFGSFFVWFVLCGLYLGGDEWDEVTHTGTKDKYVVKSIGLLLWNRFGPVGIFHLAEWQAVRFDLKRDLCKSM